MDDPTNEQIVNDDPNDKPAQPGFAQLDHLLDSALALDEPARGEFLDALAPHIRARVMELLELSDALTIGKLADQAAQTIENLAAQNDTGVSAAGRWRLQRELGSGGMGQVFYATREEPASDQGASHYLQQAAVKVLWSHRANDESMARFFRERRILAALDHPGLARFLDGGFLADGRPWFAMEYVDGIDVVEYTCHLSVPETLSVFLEICAATAYAHERLIVHRDIKPQNVLVDGTGRARLLDFGVASVLDDVSDDLRTRTQGGPLTLMYASPEQVQGDLVTVASDIYQLGLLLYQMLTNRVAFDVADQSLQGALQMINEQLPVKPSVFASAISPDLDAIILTALRKDPSQRYRSVDALAEDIQRFNDGKPVQAVPSSRWYVARRFIRRNALVVTIATAAVVGLSVATGISLRMADEATEQARRSTVAQQILADVFQKAEPFGDTGADTSLAQALLRAQPDIERRVADDPLLAWEVHSTLGGIYQEIGLVEHEAAAWQAVLDAARLLGDQGGKHLLTGIAGFGGTLARTNPADAVAYFAANMPDQPSSDETVQPWLNAQYSYIGALRRMRDFASADTQALRMADVVSDYNVTTPRILGRLNQQLAGVARRAGNMEEELQHWREAVEHMRLAQSPAALAVTLSNSAITFGRAGRYQESKAAFLDAIEIYKSAEHEDDSLAGILRGYAGLLFRMGDQAQAVATTRRALEILDPEKQAYARFIAQLNLVHYTFVIGEARVTLEVMLEALTSTRPLFEDDASIPRRMLHVFAKLLVFADEDELATTALGASDCDSRDDLFVVLDALEDPTEQDIRNELWATLSDLVSAHERGELVPAQLEQALRMYANQTPAFFDVLDRLRVQQMLNLVAASHKLPPEVVAEFDELQNLRRSAQAHLDAVGWPLVVDWVTYFANTTETPVECGR